MNKKPLARNRTSVQKNRPRINYKRIGKPFRKNPVPKIKNSENQSKIDECEQKTASDKTSSGQTPFSHLAGRLPEQLRKKILACRMQEIEQIDLN